MLPVKPVQGQAQHTFFRAKVIIPRHFLKFGVSCCKSGVVQRRKKSDANSWVYVRQHCAEIDEAARNRIELIVRSLAEQNGVTEQLKAENQMEWVRQMNACKAQAEEVVKFELIYD